MTERLNQLRLLALLFIVLPGGITQANELPSTVQEMRVEMDVVNFELRKDKKLERLKALIPHSEELAKQNETDAGYQMMAGFFNLQYAGSKGGVGALKYAKASRTYLEKSVELDPTIYNASAHAVLGSLYSKVPGWPIGFGDKKKADAHYTKALELSPNSIDSNFSYATYLFEKKEYARAKTYLEKAKLAPSRPSRPRADEEVRKVIEQALIEIETKLKK